MTTPPTKRGSIASTLRARIIAGELAPGALLPTRRELMRSFAASSITVQEALDSLRESGFVVAAGRHGTRVVPHPPHACAYGIAFGMEVGGDAFGWPAVVAAIARRASVPERRFEVFAELEGPHGRPHAEFAAALAQERLAGVIVPYQWRFVREWAPLAQSTLPRVLFDYRPAPPGWTVLDHGPQDYDDRALATLRSAGATSLAVIALPYREHHARLARLREAARACGLGFHDRWLQTVSMAEPRWARNAVLSLLHRDQGERPDSLLILDEHLVEPATAAVRELGLRVPAELRIVAHCNFPVLPTAHVPVTWLGWDMRAFLDAAVAAIDLRRRGRPVPTRTVMPPRIE